MKADQLDWTAPAASPQSHPTSTIRNLQLLRAVAAVLVVVFHMQRSAGEMSGIRYHFEAGAWGVDIFFVISGFIMFHTTVGFRRSGRQFIADRIIRVVPLYWVATLALYSLYVIGFHPNGVQQASPLDLVTSLLFIPRHLPHGAPVLLSLGWTLIYEFLFYVLFAATFFMRSHVRSLIALTAIFTLLGALPLMVPDLPYTLGYYTNTIVFEFIFGAALALAFPHLPRGDSRLVAVAGLIMIVLGVISIADVPVDKLDNGLAWDSRAWRAGIPALGVVAGALLLERAGWICRSAPLLVLGAASYSLYLFHPLVLQPALKIIDAVVHLDGVTMILFTNLTVLTAACVVAIGMHFLVEMPVIAALRRRRKRVSAPDGVAMAPVAVSLDVAASEVVSVNTAETL